MLNQEEPFPIRKLVPKDLELFRILGPTGHMPQRILITNDDGIESGFLHSLARALEAHFEISIAAPASEQSWIGRAVSRHREVSVCPHPELPWQAWTVDGTPTDCINIALGNLLQETPIAVVSGINIGYNTTVPLIYSSGTVAGAMEGAFWGLPAFAVSQQIPDTIFAEVTRSKGRLNDHWQETLDANAAHAAGLIKRLINAVDSASSDAIVHNLNYPARPTQPYETVLTVPAALEELPFYRETRPGVYGFHFQHGDEKPSDRLTDREALERGWVSHGILNFSGLGRELNN